MSPCACTIDAEYKGEERYSKLSLAYATEEECQQINDAIKEITPSCSLTPSIYNSDVSGGRKVIVIEYHDDYDREAGDVFEKLMTKLGIDKCC